MTRAEKSVIHGRDRKKTEIHYSILSDGFPIVSHPLYRPDWFYVPLKKKIPKKSEEFRGFNQRNFRFYLRFAKKVGKYFERIRKELAGKYNDNLPKEMEVVIDQIVTEEKYIADSLNAMKKNSGIKGRVTSERMYRTAIAIHDAKWYLKEMEKEVENLKYLDYFLLQDYFTRCV